MLQNEKLLPQCVDIERIVIGLVMVNPKLWYAVKAKLRDSDFYLQENRIIFRELEKIVASGKPIDTMILKHSLETDGLLEKAGGTVNIIMLTDGIPIGIATDSYCDIVLERSKLRQSIQAAMEFQDLCYEAKCPISEIINEHSSRLRKIVSSTTKNLTPGFTCVSDAYKFLQERDSDKRYVTGIATGISELDRMTTGFQPQDLVVIYAKTGRGKTALAHNCAAHSILRDKKKVMIVSCEMNRQQVVLRMISSEARVDSKPMKTGHLTREEWNKVSAASSSLSVGRFWVYDGGINISELEAYARRLHEEQDGLDLIIVDYLQLVRPGRRLENRTQEVSEISHCLKELAANLDTCVIALSQVNSIGEARESRTIEHDADYLISIEMDWEKLMKENPVPAEIVIIKARNGSIGRLEVQFRKTITTFESIAR